MTAQLLVGGRIYSPTSPDATAMAVEDGTVVWLGADGPGRALHPDAEIIELDGAFVAPAFVDPHVHATALGLQLTGLDLTGARSRHDLLRLVRAHAAANPDGVLIGHGWDETAWADTTLPTLDELDAAAPGRPVYLTRIDAHSALVSPALADTVHVRAHEHHRVRAIALGLIDAAQRDRARRAALDHAARQGVVAVHECAGPEISGRDDLRELLAVEHGVEVRAYWGQSVASPEEARALLADTGAHALGGDLFVDGALGSHTAWLREPYADEPHTGVGYLDTDTIAAHLLACTRAGIQAGFHAIGDAAVGAVVDGLERVVRAVGNPAVGNPAVGNPAGSSPASSSPAFGGPTVAACGHRIEHLEMVDAAQAAKLGAWGVIASVQPVFDALWGGPDGMYAGRLGERAHGMNPFATLASAGVSLAVGSDAPVTPLRPWDAIRAAVHHRTPDSGISPRAAFAATTRGAWRAGGVRDGVAGTLVPGAPASYAVWDVAELVVAAPADRVQRWSTDPRSRVPPLPRLDTADPICLRTVHRGVTIHAG